uniref:Uncharacterized protein n=1 Tax=Lotus japonicus TaxID=34305 RepID=I3S2T6_LOTJA|nr:unknown [Lotus japonicus]
MKKPYCTTSITHSLLHKIHFVAIFLFFICLSQSLFFTLSSKGIEKKHSKNWLGNHFQKLFI